MSMAWLVASKACHVHGIFACARAFLRICGCDCSRDAILACIFWDSLSARGELLSEHLCCIVFEFMLRKLLVAGLAQVNEQRLLSL